MKNHHQGHGFNTSHLYSNLPKELDNPELRCCFFVYECLVFACPLVVLCVKSLFCFLMFLYACVDCALFILSEGELKHFPIEQMQFVFCFLEVVLVFQLSVAMFYCFCLNPHAFLCVSLHSSLSCSIFSVVHLQYKLIESAEAVFCFA